MPETDQVRIARITSKQAILVALITSLAGLLGAAIQKYGFGESAAPVVDIQQDEVRFRGIEFDGSTDVQRYRVVMNVDGVPYSYPGRSVWKKVGPKVPDQGFPLRADRREHTVGIEVFAETADGETLALITEQDKTLDAGSGVTNLRVVRRDDIERAGSAMATVQIEITML